VRGGRGWDGKLAGRRKIGWRGMLGLFPRTLSISLKSLEDGEREETDIGSFRAVLHIPLPCLLRGIFLFHKYRTPYPLYPFYFFHASGSCDLGDAADIKDRRDVQGFELRDAEGGNGIEIWAAVEDAAADCGGGFGGRGKGNWPAADIAEVGEAVDCYKGELEFWVSYSYY